MINFIVSMLLITIYPLLKEFYMENRNTNVKKRLKFRQVDFITDYDRRNPVTHRNTYKKYLVKLDLIPKQIQDVVSDDS